MPDLLNDRYTLQLPPSLQKIFVEVDGYIARGDWLRASEAVLRLRRAAPKSIPVLTLAAMVSLKLGHYREARSLVLQAAVPPIDVPDLLLQVVRWLRRYEEPEALERVVQGSVRRGASVPVLAELALHLGSIGLYAPAFECVEQALQRSPNDANLHYLRALFEMFSGNTEASIEACECALSIRPGMPNTHLLLSMQGSKRFADRHISEMRRALMASGAGTEEEAYLCYSLHQRLDALGQHDEAWQVLIRGHAARRRITPYKREEQAVLFHALKKMTLPAFQPASFSMKGTNLIFIVGMFRSGTTLIERVLAGHRDVVDGGETYQLSGCMREATNHDCTRIIDTTIVARAPGVDFASVRRRMHAYAGWRSAGRRWLTEKLPSNFLNLGFILHAFPEARILHMQRDPIDTCFSNLRTSFSGAAPYACDQEDLADYYLRYRDLMAHWHALAPGRILDVDYAAFVADPLAQARRVMDHCGLDFLPELLDVGREGGMSATASAAHVRKGILPNRGQAWKPYADALMPMIRALQPEPSVDQNASVF